MGILISSHQTITKKVVVAAAACVVSVFAELTWDQLSAVSHRTASRSVGHLSTACADWITMWFLIFGALALWRGEKMLSRRNHIKQADSRSVTWLSSFTVHWFIYLFVQRCWCHQSSPACLWEPKRMREGKKRVTSENDESASLWRCH